MNMELIRLSSLGRKAPRTVPPEAASSSPAPVEKVPHALGGPFDNSASRVACHGTWSIFCQVLWNSTPGYGILLHITIHYHFR